jgi:hypothetical protein
LGPETLAVPELDELALRQVRRLVLLHREHQRLHDLLLLFLLLLLLWRWLPVWDLLLRVRIRVVVVLGVAE